MRFFEDCKKDSTILSFLSDEENVGSLRSSVNEFLMRLIVVEKLFKNKKIPSSIVLLRKPKS